jgi:ABC-type proline/glycine betaine transport system substrate-binding protein
MLRVLAIVILLLPFFAGGCAWQANAASEKVNINPFAWGSGQNVISPADK